MKSRKRLPQSKMLVAFLTLAALLIGCAGDGGSGDDDGSGSATPDDAETSTESTPNEGDTEGDSEAQEPVVWNIGLAALPPQGLVNGTNLWAEEIETRSEGRLQIRLHYSDTPMPAPQQLDATQDGRLEGLWLTDGYYPDRVPLFNVVGIPFETSDPYAAAHAFYDMQQSNELFRQESVDNNLHPFYWVPFGTTVVTSNKPLNSLEDLSGLRMRAIGHLATVLDLAGGDPVAVAPGEIYESLQREVLDGLFGFPFDTLPDLSIHEVQDHVTETGSGHYTLAFIGVNKEEWDAIPADLQVIVDEVSQEWQRTVAIEELIKLEAAACDTLKEAGVEMNVWTDQQRQELEQAVGDAPLEAWLTAAQDATGHSEQELLDFHDQFLEAYESHLSDSPYESAVATCAEG